MHTPTLFQAGLVRWQREPLLAFEEFLAQYRFGRRTLRPSSYAIYRGMFERLLAWCLAQDIALLSLTQEDLQRFLDSRPAERGQHRATGLSPLSRHRYLLLFRALFDHWQTLGRLEPSPTQPTPTKSEDAPAARAPLENAALHLLTHSAAPEREQPEHLTAQECELLVQALLETLREGGHLPWKRLRDAALVLTLLGAGLRVGELLALHWDQLSWDPSGKNLLSVHVPEHLPYPARDIEGVHPFAVEALQRWKTQHATSRLAPGRVFPADRAARALSAATVYRHVQAALHACGLHRRYEGPTLLRNSCALLWLKQGVPLAQVTRWLGHRQQRSTEALLGVGLSSAQALTESAAEDRLV